MVVQCCVCHRVREGKEWIRSAESQAMVSHSYCPECFAETKRQFVAQVMPASRGQYGAQVPA